jgi:hypothetical protein
MMVGVTLLVIYHLQLTFLGPVLGCLPICVEFPYVAFSVARNTQAAVESVSTWLI